MSANNDCDGSGPHSPEPVRVLPLGGDGNLLLCYDCFVREIAYRRDRNKELGKAYQFSTPPWLTLRVYRSE